MNRYFQEVVDAHALISHWLGDETAAIEVCEALLARFSPAYSMVTPGGAMLDFTALNAFFRAQRGAKRGLRIDIENMQLVAESTGGATVTYQERQQLPGQNATLRFSTVVFVSEPDGTVRWRHLHETALPTP
ncbi:MULTISPECIES: DUF4440 domain-containing protein [unclassified Pseudescherichia]|jgi:hypothetical protein|uniref:DUF4440 domain-containing protein n=1 Tax=unclassified Pseudescherichia TaxID=2620545 RepID=UPI00214FC39A|nr:MULTISPECIES: DUF4440 domain-containing protein [unclassified Pseudescherichia]MCR4457330.1 DUF4440 domain-containing protein [Pseudescherichia sp. L3]